MDTKKIGGFLKQLRNEKGLTQEQLAESLLVSGRTVSRWETGTNLPDLSILIQIAEFYDVEISEILDGKRRDERMDKELKETLCKVADYNKLEKEKMVKVGNTAFVILFIACSAATMIQLIAGVGISAVLGETIAMVVGGVAYIGMMLHLGLWETSSSSKEILIGVLCSAGATAAFTVRSLRLGMPFSRVVQAAPIFFLGIAAIGFTIMKVLALINRRRQEKRDKV